MEQKQANRKYKSHPFSERKRVVELYESGLGSRRIARAMNLDMSMVRRWLRRYRASGLESLVPYYRTGIGEKPEGALAARRVMNERLFSPAYEALSTTLEPMASIARRYGLDYIKFVYHVKKFHPQLIAQRDKLLHSVSKSAEPAQTDTNETEIKFEKNGDNND